MATLVQSKRSAWTGAGGAITLTFNSGLTGGNNLLAAVWGEDESSAPAIIDTAGWTLVRRVFFSGGADSLSIWKAGVAAGSTVHVPVGSGSPRRILSIFEVNGNIDVHNFATTSFYGGGTITGPALTPTDDGFLLAFAFGRNPTYLGTATLTPTAPLTTIFAASKQGRVHDYTGTRAVTGGVAATPVVVVSGAGFRNSWGTPPAGMIAIAVVSAASLAPIAEFTATPTFGTAPLSVAFDSTGTTNSPTSWLWDFGDGATSTLQNPTHIYAAEGSYDVTLTATNADGSGSVTHLAYINVYQAVAFDVWEIAPPGDGIAFLGTLEEATNKAIRPVRNEPGSGQFTINRYSPDATTAMLGQGNLVKVRIPAIDADYIYSFFLEQGDDTLVSTDEEGGELITKRGRGALSYWERAIWLSEKFTIPWWDGAWGTPPAGARGHVTFKAGTYKHFNIVGGVIDGADTDGGGWDSFTTAGFEAYFDTRQTYLWPDENDQRFLVHIMAGETHAGWYVHPHQKGVIETLPSQTVGTSSSVLLSDISPDTPGAILYRLWQEGQDPARPTQPIPLMSVDFTATTDSNGDPWATTDALAGLTAELGETYLETIAKLLSTGVIDVEMGPNLEMHAYNAQGRDLTGTTFGAGKVRFVKGVNIAGELRREQSDTPVATFIEVIGTDNVTGQATLADAASRIARETSATGDSSDAAVLEALGLAALESALVKSDAIGLPIAIGDDDAAGLYLPGPPGSDHGDFWLGDLVTLHTGTGENDFDQADERVAAISIAEDEAGNLDVVPEVGSALGEAERRLFANTQARIASFVSRSQFSDTQVAEPTHPDLTTHDALGLATDAEFAAHTGDTVDAHDASAVSFAPAAGLAATDVQGAIVEDAGDLADHLADTSDAHDASAVSIVDSGSYFGSSTVEGALQELGAAGPGGGGGTNAVNYSARSSNTILGTGDRGYIIDATAAFTQTVDAAATLGAGWWCVIRNATTDGTSLLIVDPNGAETIDGLGTATMYSGEQRLVSCDGSNFHSTMLQGGYALFTATGSFIPPAGMKQAHTVVVGGGGGGGGGRGSTAGTSRNGGSPGGGGARSDRTVAAATFGAAGSTCAVVVSGASSAAAGGSSGDGTNGSAGGLASIASSGGSILNRAYGGGGGLGGSNVANNRSGGAGGGVGEVGGNGVSNAGSKGGGQAAAANAGQTGFGGFGAGGQIATPFQSQNAEYGGGCGGFAQGSDNAVTDGGNSVYGGGGGGAGGGLFSNVERAGGVGGGTGISALGGSGGTSGAVNGGAGGNGAAGNGSFSGAGGGGGGSQDSGTGGAGGDGGAPGGGGGGGGAGTTVGGAGGKGARGEVRVYYL